MRRNAERNAGYEGMSEDPALAHGFFGNLGTIASKMETIVDELMGSCQEVWKNGSLDVADPFHCLVWA
ncbi:hypothetical protein [Algoriphagus faecimaris]|uniref:hypothetical protein n=1 Tax=Algoriphagus faecimaris TaxID=686796 RepID=UPI000B431FF9|nr:hypothetical protein [Algoriphagus faecimaris]